MSKEVKIIRHTDPLLSVYRGDVHVGLIFPPVHNGHQDFHVDDKSFLSEKEALDFLLAK